MEQHADVHSRQKSSVGCSEQRSINIKAPTDGQQPPALFRSPFFYISGFDNKDEGKKKMDGVQRCPTDGRRWRPGRPLALIIKLRNCTDNESVCLRVKALGDTRRRRRPCWRCQKRSEAAPLSSADRFRPQPFLLMLVTINQMNPFKFNLPPQKV